MICTGGSSSNPKLCLELPQALVNHPRDLYSSMRMHMALLWASRTVRPGCNAAPSPRLASIVGPSFLSFESIAAATDRGFAGRERDWR
jgi:hypothetical protein